MEVARQVCSSNWCCAILGGFAVSYNQLFTVPASLTDASLAPLCRRQFLHLPAPPRMSDKKLSLSCLVKDAYGTWFIATDWGGGGGGG